MIGELPACDTCGGRRTRLLVEERNDQSFALLQCACSTAWSHTHGAREDAGTPAVAMADLLEGSFAAAFASEVRERPWITEGAR